MTWTRYPKIAGDATIVAGSSSRNAFVVTEKLHGANFSVVVSAAGAVEFASRSKVLAADDNFFGMRSQGLDASLAPLGIDLYSTLLQEGHIGDNDGVAVYGELCGGKYPQSSVQPVPRLGPVQRGCWYTPGLVFVAFDVAVFTKGTGLHRFLDYDKARSFATAAGFLFVPELFRGTLTECLNFEVRFSSHLPAILGLPKLDEPNWAEGIVVRPQQEPSLPTARGMTKLKIPEFAEKQYRNDGWRESRSGTLKSEIEPGLDMRELLRWEISAAVNDNRLESVVSKLGHVNPCDKDACRGLFQAFVNDVEEALVDDGLLESTGQLIERHIPQYDELQAASRKLVVGYLRHQIRRSTLDVQ